jgi:hypothetical protein
MKKLTIAMMLVLVGYGLSANAASITLTREYDGDLVADPNSPYNMTARGEADWKFWNNSLTVPLEQKNGGSGIGDLSFTAGTGGGTFSSGISGRNPLYSFTDGTSTASRTDWDNKAIFKSPTVDGINDTISFTVAASTKQSALYIVAGVQEGTLEISASLAGATDQTDQYVQTGNNPLMALYKLVYTADSDSDLLTVSWKKTAVDNGDASYIFVQSAALSVIPEPATLSMIASAGLALLLLRRRIRR